MDVLKLQQREAWLGVTGQADVLDFHHLPFYHQLSEELGEGEAHLFVHREGEDFVAIPLLLRSLEDVPCHGAAADGWRHATSVYGYAGPIVSRPDLPDATLERFRGALTDQLRQLRVASVFTRLHPLLDQQRVLRGIGELIPHGQTVSIDLTLPTDIQRTHFRSNHKRDLNKLARTGAVCVNDTEGRFLDEFVEVYTQSMRRLDAGRAYYFGRDYFERFFTTPEVESWLSVVLLDDAVAACGLFTKVGGLVQAHLNGTRDEYLRQSPAKLMYDGARRWADTTDAAVMHIGGGLGGGDDPLFRFKAGFSRRQHDFVLFKWVLQSDVVAVSSRRRDAYRQQAGLSPAPSGFFPPYLCPGCPCASP